MFLTDWVSGLLLIIETAKMITNAIPQFNHIIQGLAFLIHKVLEEVGRLWIVFLCHSVHQLKMSSINPSIKNIPEGWPATSHVRKSLVCKISQD